MHSVNTNLKNECLSNIKLLLEHCEKVSFWTEPFFSVSHTPPTLYTLYIYGIQNGLGFILTVFNIGVHCNIVIIFSNVCPNYFVFNWITEFNLYRVNKNYKSQQPLTNNFCWHLKSCQESIIFCMQIVLKKVDSVQCLFLFGTTI